MSTLAFNELRPATGTQVLIPTGTNLTVGGVLLDAATLLPDPSGGPGKLYGSDGTNIIFTESGAKAIQVFTQGGTYIPSPGTRLAHVRLVGAGGGGSGYGESGASGGYAEAYINVVGVSQVTVTVGQGGGGTYYSGGAASGNTTSFGTYLTATGGNGANSSHQHCGGLPGLGSGSTFAYYGGGGTGHGYNGRGGTNFFGGCGAAGHPQGGNYNNNHASHAVPGTGGANGWAYSYVGSTGRNGMVCIWEYA